MPPQNIGSEVKSVNYSKYIIVILIVILIIAGGFGAYYYLGKSNSNTQNNPSVNNSIPGPVSDSKPVESVNNNPTASGPQYGSIQSMGILSVQTTPGVSIAQGSVTVGDTQPQSSSVFAPGNDYIMHLPGLKGFTEFHPYDAPAAFVDFTGKFTLYDGNNNVVYNNDNLFSTYYGGVSATDAQNLQATLTIPKNISTGNYRWEFIVTDKKNSGNSLKAVVNFSI